jgi:hypothetical protein
LDGKESLDEEDISRPIIMERSLSRLLDEKTPLDEKGSVDQSWHRYRKLRDAIEDGDTQTDRSKTGLENKYEQEQRTKYVSSRFSKQQNPQATKSGTKPKINSKAISGTSQQIITKLSLKPPVSSNLVR